MLFASAAATASGPKVTAPPEGLKLDPFYTRYVDAAGLPLLSSSKVPDEALVKAQRIVRFMLAKRRDLAKVLREDGSRFAIMALDEQTTDLPEQRDWKKPASDDPRLTPCERKHYAERIGALTDREYWNTRARGMSGLLTSGSVEDLLGWRTSRYFGETIFIHEFAHAILRAAQQRALPPAAQVEAAYRAALAKGLWQGNYASVSAHEYWAEGTQFWFNSNYIAVFDGRQILSDADLAAYDRALADALRAVYGKRHHVPGDPFYRHPARVPPGPLPANTAEVC